MSVTLVIEFDDKRDELRIHCPEDVAKKGLADLTEKMKLDQQYEGPVSVGEEAVIDPRRVIAAKIERQMRIAPKKRS